MICMKFEGYSVKLQSRDKWTNSQRTEKQLWAESETNWAAHIGPTSRLGDVEALGLGVLDAIQAGSRRRTPSASWALSASRPSAAPHQAQPAASACLFLRPGRGPLGEPHPQRPSSRFFPSAVGLALDAARAMFFPSSTNLAIFPEIASFAD